MKVVLLKDVPGVGKRSEVKNVSDGYALNFLIPKKLVVAGTAFSIAHAERLAPEEAAERDIAENLLYKNLSSAEGTVIEMTGKANKEGSLFASIHKEAIAAELRKQKHIDLSAECLEIEKPIKEVGTHRILVSARGKKGSFTLLVKEAQGS